ncbi:Methylthioadenosine phosphorylase [Mycena vulgaris]|nr:Methylthioadenosine phosphorylase [Mycena vulgaris]
MAIDKVLVGVIGGSGLYNLDNLTFVKHVTPETPWGSPSSPITIAALPSGAQVAFLARHGTAHTIPPSALPYRANIAALKSLGVRTILAFSAVGSLREEIAPGDFALPSQLIDRTKGVRATSFFDGTGVVAHAGFSDPYSPKLGAWLAEAVKEALKDEGRGVKLHTGCTLVVMEGPQFSTRAESVMYRQWGGDLIGMTALPEAKLAREAEIAFALIATATDYDAWRPHEAGVTAAQVGTILRQNADTSRHVAASVIERLLEAASAAASGESSEAAKAGKTLLDEEAGSMQFALMAPPASIKNAALAYVLPEYFGV